MRELLLLLLLVLGGIWVFGAGTGKWSETTCPPTKPYTFCILLSSGSSIGSIAFSPDGKLLASASEYERHEAVTIIPIIRLWEVTTGQLVRTFRTFSNQADRVISMAFDPEGKLLTASVSCYSCSAESEIKLWEITTGREIATISTESGDVAFSPEGRLLSASGDAFEGVTIKVWDVVTGQRVRSISLLPTPRGRFLPYYSPDGRLLAAFMCTELPTCDINLWDTSTGKLVRTLSNPQHPPIPWLAAFSPDSKLIATTSCVSNSKDPEDCPLRIGVWELATGRLLRTFTSHDKGWVWGRHNPLPQALAFSPNAGYAASSAKYSTFGAFSTEGETKLLEVATGRVAVTLTGDINGNSGIYSDLLAFSPDGRLLASGESIGGTIALWYVGNLAKK